MRKLILLSPLLIHFVLAEDSIQALIPQSKWHTRYEEFASKLPADQHATLFERILDKNPTPDAKFLNAYFQIVFCLDGSDSTAAGELFFKAFRENPALVMNTLDNTFNELNKSTNANQTFCMENIPDLSFKADAYVDFSRLLKETTQNLSTLPDATKSAHLSEYLAWKEKLQKSDTAALKRTEEVTLVIDQNLSAVFQ